MLPDGAARAAGRAAASLVRWPLGLRREVVEDQLAAAFPERDPGWVRETARACYRHFGEELALLCGRPPRIEAALRSVRDPHPLREVVEEARRETGRGAVVVTGHLGNWELAGAYVAGRGLEVTAVIQRQRGPGGERVEALQRRLGFETAYRDASPRRLLRSLAAGGVLALVADQHARRGGARIDFLGRPAWTTLGPARLALAAGAPLFFGALVREGPGYHLLFERLDAPGRTTGADEPPELALTRAWSTALEAAVRERPAQYYWFHRRWKGAGPEATGNARPGGDVVEAC